MNASLFHYLTGDEVHIGDRVRYKGESNNVVFVSDGEGGEFAAGYADYHGHEAGIMLSSDDGDLIFIVEPNEDLELLGHGGLLPPTHQNTQAPGIQWPTAGF